MNRLWLVLAALGIGAAVVAAEDLLFSLLTGRPLSFAADVQPVSALFVALPFLVLAITGARTRLPWLVGLALTLGLWGYFLNAGVSYQWHPDGSGVNIGLAFIMLASPLVFTPILLAVHMLQARQARRS